MLTTLYSFLLRRRTRAFPPQVAREMLATFHEAREDAARQGLFAYLRFGGRELAGVAWPSRGAQLHAPSKPHRLRWVASCALAGGLIAGGVAYQTPAKYVSSAALQFVSSPIPERLIPSAGRPDSKQQFRNSLATVLSRRTLTEIIRSYGLYRSELARMPLEDVIEKMRKDIAVRSRDGDMVEIRFVYASPREAQKVARDLMTRLVDANIRERSEELKVTSRFLADRSEAAAKLWMESTAALQRMKESDPQYPRASLDVELARKEYQTLRERMSDARMAEAARGATLEILDLPSLPQQELLNRPLVVATGVFAGLLLGLLITWIRSIRPPDLMAPAATSA